MNLKLDHLRKVMTKSKENKNNKVKFKKDSAAPAKKRKRKREPTPDYEYSGDDDKPYPAANGILLDNAKLEKKQLQNENSDKHVHFDEETTGSSSSSGTCKKVCKKVMSLKKGLHQ